MLDLSIIIPVFNEAKKIQTDIEAASEFLMAEGLSGEIIVVDDGSTDDTVACAKSIQIDPKVNLTVISYTENKGKGHAVKTGVKASQGQYVMFADSGLCIPYNNALRGLTSLRQGKFDIANGSRKHRDSNIKRKANAFRRFLSSCFRNVIYLFLGIPRHFTDTQCGFKIYKGDVARELYAQCQTDGFLFDIEIILLALKRNAKVMEFPVQWSSDPDTRVFPHRTVFKILTELFDIRKRTSKTNNSLLIAGLVIVALIRIATIGTYPLMDKTEARYAEIAREMIVSNNLVTPLLDPDVPFWGKPPLSFWFTVISFKIFGINEFGARIASVFLGGIAVFLTFLFGARMRNKEFGLSAALMLSTIGLFFINAGSVMTDPALLVAITLSMVSFALTFLDKNRRRATLWSYLVFVGLGLSFLAKGPVGWVITLMPIFFWCFICRQWKNVFNSFPWFFGILITICIALPWYLMAEQQTPGFLEYFFVGEHWQRFTQSGWDGDLYGRGHAQPKGMIWLYTIPSTLPWTIIFVASLWWILKRKKSLKSFMNQWVIYLILWILSPLVLFTLSSNILMTYIIPSLPPFALLLTYFLTALDFNSESGKRPWFLSMKVILPMVSIVPVFVFFAAFTFLPFMGNQYSQLEIVKMFEKHRRSIDAELVYIEEMPHSADFYSNGQAKDITDEYGAKIMQEINDQDEDFFVVESQYIYRLPYDILSYVEMVGKHRDYILFQELDLSLVSTN